MGKLILSSTKDVSKGNLYSYHLPKGIVKMALKRVIVGEDTYYFLVKPEVQLIPDPEHRYYFQYQVNAFTNDDITVEFNDQGFLRRIHTLIDDQTDDFINKIGELAGSVFEAAASMSGFKVRSTGVREEMIYEQILDPFHEGDVANFNAVLKKFDPNLTFVAEVKESEERTINPKGSEFQGKAGVFCRPPAIVELRLEHPNQIDRHLLRMPHPSSVQFVGIPWASFVQTEFEMQMNEMGYPTSIRVKKPSTAMALIQLPINIAKAIVELPAKLFSLKINLDNSRPQPAAPTSLPPPPTGSMPGVPRVDTEGGPGPNAPQQARGMGEVDSEKELKKLRQDVDLLRRRMNKD